MDLSDPALKDLEAVVKRYFANLNSDTTIRLE